MKKAKPSGFLNASGWTRLPLYSAALLGVATLAGCVGVAPPAHIPGDSPLAAFTTDACSLFPNGTFSRPKLWCHCCVEHDKAYWQGGDREARAQADLALKSCVEKSAGTILATAMWMGVRVGGDAYLPTSFRWGYGWPYARGYQILNTDEGALARMKLQSYLDSILEHKASDICGATEAAQP